MNLIADNNGESINKLDKSGSLHVNQDTFTFLPPTRGNTQRNLYTYFNTRRFPSFMTCI